MADTDTARDEALRALSRWARQRAALDSSRQTLVVAAWRAGEHNVAELARAAGVARDTIYSDLKEADLVVLNKDPAITGVIQALTQVVMAFNPGNGFDGRTVSRLGGPVLFAANTMKNGTTQELCATVRDILDAPPPAPGDVGNIGPLLANLRDQFRAYEASLAG